MQGKTQILSRIFSMERMGPSGIWFCLNASAAFVSAGVADNFSEVLMRAKDSIDSGRAMEKLEGRSILPGNADHFFGTTAYRSLVHSPISGDIGRETKRGGQTQENCGITAVNGRITYPAADFTASISDAKQD